MDINLYQKVKPRQEDSIDIQIKTRINETQPLNLSVLLLRDESQRNQKQASSTCKGCDNHSERSRKSARSKKHSGQAHVHDH